MKRTNQIGGDAYAEVIRDEEGDILNLKPLDPGSMSNVVNGQGILIRFEQTSKVRTQPKKFNVNQIFYLPRNRVADEIHGVSLIEALEWIILAKNETMADWKRVMHRNVDPVIIIHADTDDATAIAKIKSDWEKVKKDGETWVVPKDVVVPELLAVSPNAVLTPVNWLQFLDDKFYEAANVPKIIVGGIGGITEAAVKIAYLAFEQNVEEDQLEIEEQVWEQLGYKIELEFPTSLKNELLSDKSKDQGSSSFQANETTAGVGQ